MAIGKLPDAEEAAEEGGESIFAEINITPLTDVFLVLVIIFMVSALAVQVEATQKQQKIVAQQQKMEEIQKKSGLKLDLPQGQAQELNPNEKSLIVEIPVSGKVMIGGQEYPPDQLDRLFQNAFARDKSTQVVIKADKSVLYGIAVGVMEHAKHAGLTHLAIQTSGGS